jgi:hypothetical protein
VRLRAAAKLRRAARAPREAASPARRAAGWRAAAALSSRTALRRTRRLILCEASTPFLNARWLYKCARRGGAAPCSRASGADARRAPRRRARARRTAAKRDPAALSRAAVALGYRTPAGLKFGIDAVFGAAFLATRVLGFGAGLAQLVAAARGGYLGPLSHGARSTMLALLSAGFALNLLWTARLLPGLRKSHAAARAAEAAAGAAEAAAPR